MSDQSNIKENTMKYKVLTILMVSFAVVFLPMSGKVVKERPVIQMAILLDTSGSMQGLIAQAKSQLWTIVNEMATSKRSGLSPRLNVALYEYGKSSISRSEGYIKMIVPLSADLDRLSEELFKLRTNGGSEYCGQVIQSATNELRWSKNNSDLKVIFIAGNEPFTQGSVDYRVACKDAITKGIIVNTIFCGDAREGIRTFWKDGADLADGKYINIDQNKKVVYISAPQDKEIITLGMKLNKTYIAYGRKGLLKKARQTKQDKNALAMSKEVMVQRAAAKSNIQYENSSWDMVDAVKEGKLDLDKLDEKELPEEMQKMTKDERKKYVLKMKMKRKDIQEKIKVLKKARDKYVIEQRKKESGKDTLDSAILRAIRKQAGKKGYKFDKK